MNNQIEWWMIAAVLAMFSALIAAISSLIKNIEYLRSKSEEPFKKIEKKIDESNKKTNDRLDLLQKDMNFMFTSQSMILEHMATGNDIESLRKQHKEMNEYLISTRRG